LTWAQRVLPSADADTDSDADADTGAWVCECVLVSVSVSRLIVARMLPQLSDPSIKDA